MIIAVIIAILYMLLLVAAVCGIGYFIIKRKQEKALEKDILKRDDY